MRAGRGARRFDRLGRHRCRDQAAAERMEDDRAGQEEPIRSDLAAVSRRLRSLFRALRAAPRDCPRRARRRTRSDLRRARGAGRRRRPKKRPLPRHQRAPHLPAAAPQELLAAVRGLRSRWQQEIAARGVDRDRAVALDAAVRRGVRARARRTNPRRLRAAISIPTRIASGWKRSCKRIEELAGSGRPARRSRRGAVADDAGWRRC